MTTARLFFQKNWDVKFFKKALIIILPVTFQVLIEALSSFSDNFIIGNYSEGAFNGLTAANITLFVVFSIVIGFCAGSSIFGAQYIGARKYREYTFIFIYRIFITLLFILLAFTLIQLFAPQIINLIIHSSNNHHHEALASGTNYLQISSGAYIIWSISLCIIFGLRDQKKVIIPFIITVIALTIKVVFSITMVYGFLFFPKMGITGAALASIIGRSVEFLLLFCYLLVVKKTLLFQKFIYLPICSLIKHCNSRIIFVVINELFWSSAIFINVSAYGLMGSSALATMQAAYSFNDLFFTTIQGMGIAVMVFVGHSLGEGDFKSAKENSQKLMILAVIISLISQVILLICSFIAPQLVYFNLSPTIRKNIFYFLLVSTTFFIFFILFSLFFSIIRAGGKTKLIFIIDCGYDFFVFVSATWILAILNTKYGLLNYTLIYFLTNFLWIPKVIIAYLIYHRGTWIRNLTSVNNPLSAI